MATFDMNLEKLEQYLGISPKPTDFECFWNEAQYDLEKTGLDYELAKSDFQIKGVKCSNLQFNGVGDARINCKLLVPENSDKKSAGLLMFHGYRFHSGEWSEKLEYPLAQGTAIMAMDVRGQAGYSTDTYSGSVESIYGHVTRGIDDSDNKNIFYRNVYLDTVKAARILMSMDFIDENRIGATGGSQGGALAVACAALEPRIKMLAVVYPFLSDFKRIQELDFTSEAYLQIKQYFRMRDPRHENEASFYEKLGYIDIQNLAYKIKAEVIWFCGLMDKTCPPSTQYSAYNKINGKKKMVLYPEYEHERLHGSGDIIFQFFNKL